MNSEEVTEKERKEGQKRHYDSNRELLPHPDATHTYNIYYLYCGSHYVAIKPHHQLSSISVFLCPSLEKIHRKDGPQVLVSEELGLLVRRQLRLHFPRPVTVIAHSAAALGLLATVIAHIAALRGLWFRLRFPIAVPREPTLDSRPAVGKRLPACVLQGNK